MLSALLLLITLFQSVLGYNNTQVKLKSCVLDVLGNNAAQRIVVPADATYTDARLGEAIQFKELPTLIAYAEKVPEVQGLVKCAKSAGVKAVPRSGGHHFLGYSVLTDTLVIDVTHIDDVHISEDLATVRAGGGIRLGALYTALDLHNKTFPGGICPTVGLSGYLGSGGFSLQMRELGLASDHVLSATVVTAEGEIVTASEDQNSELFWAIRGGGAGTYGIIVDWTLKTIEFPRSAMLLLTWNGTDAHFPVAQRFLEWAPTAPKAFTSQINVYKSQVQILGWYLGGTAAQLRTLVQGSGILNIGHPQIIISDGCNTDNARVFGTSINECLPDDEAKQYSSALNPFQQAFAAFGNATQFKYQESTQNADIPAADPWPRFRRKSKSFFLQKGKPLEDDILREVITRIEQLDEASQIWAEWHAWNLSSESTDFSFPWASQAKAHLEFQIHGSEDAVVQEGYDKWFTDLEHLLRPAVGQASYTGYADDTISTDPLTSYYGDNICRLISIKKRWDLEDFFSNPLSVPPTAPDGIDCT
ncbi:hypothetical protein NPX13_g1385 [Xylaria arbuscula]|uniref:FAD-binding PCMH-type domain-containing protein n=1 Tax=Xylaria arbuscula TaxID=114810 RepID=A0A9W8TQ82_9PEZI|nr:hypothetical protein NPX13_g1385 [Xylaria arbuscula]